MKQRKTLAKAERKYWTVNALADWWGSDRRTIRRAIAGLSPDKVSGQSRLYLWAHVDPTITEYLCR